MKQTRATLLASYESILDVLNNQGKNQLANQVNMFDLVEHDETQKYKYTILKEFDERELLSFEKEMLGIYVSGHPLEKYRESILKQTNINSMQIKELNGENNLNFRDNQTVRYAGTITSIKKKYTKRNTIMAFITLEDLYGNVELIVFDSVYSRCEKLLIEENIVLVEGRLSLKEDEDARIIVQNIKEFSENDYSNNVKSDIKQLIINVTNLSFEQKDKLKGAIKFFSGERINTRLVVLNQSEYKPCGGVYLNNEILDEFINIVGKENIQY